LASSAQVPASASDLPQSSAHDIEEEMSEESSSSDEENASTASLLKGFIKKLFP
jgi:hypothetical protein